MIYLDGGGTHCRVARFRKKQNTGFLVKCKFQINNEKFFKYTVFSMQYLGHT